MSRIARLEAALRRFVERTDYEGAPGGLLRQAREAFYAPACSLCDGDREIEFNDETSENFATVIACPECSS